MDILTVENLSGYWSYRAVGTNIVVLLNIAGALALGLLVGYERSYHGRAAGMRTYGFVCMASAALTVLSAYPAAWFGGHGGGAIPVDPTRVVQGVVTGIGFLGAGVIMREGFTISGLTTAASIWTSSAIGVLVGVGFYFAAIVLTLLSTALMMWGSRLENWLPARPAMSVFLRFKEGVTPRIDALSRVAQDRGYLLAMGTLAISYVGGQTEWQFVAVAKGNRSGTPFVQLADELSRLEGLESFRLMPARN